VRENSGFYFGFREFWDEDSRRVGWIGMGWYWVIIVFEHFGFNLN
jgi:hypothetical protein